MNEVTVLNILFEVHMSHGRRQSLEMQSRPSDGTSLHIAGATTAATLICTKEGPGTYRRSCGKGKWLLRELRIQHFWSEQ